MLYLMDRRRIPAVKPRTFKTDDCLLGRFGREDILARCERQPYRDTFEYVKKVADEAALDSAGIIENGMPKRWFSTVYA